MPRKRRELAVKDGQALQFDTIKARLYPTPEQAELFEKTFGCCRYIWNHMLADQQRFYEETGKHFIPTPAKYKKSAPFLTEVDNQALTQEYNHLSQAFRSYFKNPECFRHPKFKRKKTDRDSFTACNHAVSPTIWLTKDGIRMTKAGVVKAKFPRRPRSGWTLKRITVGKTKTGKYFCSILYEHPVKEPEPVAPTPETTVGLNYSRSHFYVSDDGTRADPPHWLEQSQEKLTKIQRQLSRMQTGSKNYQETLQKYRLLHEHITNQRRDYIHKESTRIANEWNAVCMRDDNLTAMTETLPGGNLTEPGYGRFRECLRYKLQRRGKQLLMVDKYFPSTRTCHNCGYTLTEPANYKRQTWRCPQCGAVLNRGTNAAQNIKNYALAQFQH